MTEQHTDMTQTEQRAREALFRHNDLSHPVIQVLLKMQLKQPTEEE